MDRLLELFFLPSMAIARVGSSTQPLDSFRYARSASGEDTIATQIEPAVSLKVQADGSVRPYKPDAISFKDAQGGIRPVAPFFELWGRFETPEGKSYEIALTPKALKGIGASTADLQYEVTLANIKAARRTANPACGFIARVAVAGNDHRVQPLLAISPHTADQEPLVLPDKPIPLGHLQVVRPVEKQAEIIVDGRAKKVDRGILRVRYTPPKGYVYGPPTAVNAPAPEVMPGVYEAPGIQFGRIHEIVPPERRILNTKTPWSTYVMLNGKFEDPQPQDGYDGAAVGSFQSWGCVDDTCDGSLVATLAVAGRRHRAVARILVGPPDFAPDRRPLFSAAHDIVDRDLPAIKIDSTTYPAAKREVLDIFERAFESVSLFNLDALRARALQENRIRFWLHSGLPPGVDKPRAGDESMTREDVDYVDKIPVLAPQDPSRFTAGVENLPLPYTSAANFAHAQLSSEVLLIDFLKRRGDVVKRIVRPPFGRFRQFPSVPADEANPQFRDPRVFRDQVNDMRMPPYIRDANMQPLSITWRQYDLLMAFIDFLQQHGEPQDATEQA